MSLTYYIMGDEVEKVPLLQICTLCPGPGEANRDAQEMEEGRPEGRPKGSPTPALGNRDK